jgi:alanine racemase
MGVRLLAVANMQEVAELRRAGDAGDILVLGAPPLNDLKEALAFAPTLCIFSVKQVEDLSRAGGCSVHIKVETGMNRIGARPGEELARILEALKNHPGVRVTGLFSHLSVADEDREGMTAAQVARFEQAIAQVKAAGFDPMCHLANTAAALNGIAPTYDGVRLGIGLYGLSPLEQEMDLKPVASWKTKITYVKQLFPGDTVGYGATFTAKEPMRIATLAVGYADGYRRSFAPGDVLIRGQRAAILGRVCMDQIMVDVTGIPDVEIADEAVLLGSQGEACISALELARRSRTIHYEVMTGIGTRVERRVRG